jgi:hypothetical protein
MPPMCPEMSRVEVVRVERAGLDPLSGQVFGVSRKSGPVWYAKFRLTDGRQVPRHCAFGFFGVTALARVESICAPSQRST